MCRAVSLCAQQVFSTVKSEKDSEERYREKMRVNERNQTFIARMKEFMQHCNLRAQHLQPASTVDGLQLPPLQAQKALLEQESRAAAAVVDIDVAHPESEVKVANDDPSQHSSAMIEAAEPVVVLSPLAKHAIFGLSSQAPPALTPLTTVSRLASLHSPPLSAGASVVATPRGLFASSLTPSTLTHTQPPPLISLPTSLPLFSPPPLSPIPSPHALEDDSPPSHIRSQSATAAVRASSRLTSFPRSTTLHRRAITANTVSHETPAGGGSSAALERLMEDERTTEIRLVRQHGATGGWRVERRGGAAAGGGGGEPAGSSQTGEADTRATLTALPRGSFSEVGRPSQSTRGTAGSGSGREGEGSAAAAAGGEAEAGGRTAE